MLINRWNQTDLTVSLWTKQIYWQSTFEAFGISPLVIWRTGCDTLIISRREWVKMMSMCYQFPSRSKDGRTTKHCFQNSYCIIISIGSLHLNYDCLELISMQIFATRGDAISQRANYIHIMNSHESVFTSNLIPEVKNHKVMFLINSLEVQSYFMGM